MSYSAATRRPSPTRIRSPDFVSEVAAGACFWATLIVSDWMSPEPVAVTWGDLEGRFEHRARRQIDERPTAPEGSSQCGELALVWSRCIAEVRPDQFRLLDNSLRFGRMVDTEWALLDMEPWLASGGYLHGAARIWSEDGTLLGVASQTASAMAWPTPPEG